LKKVCATLCAAGLFVLVEEVCCMKQYPIALVVTLCVVGVLLAPAGASAAVPVGPLTVEAVLGVDRVGENPGLSPSADLLSVVLYRSDVTGEAILRLGFVSLNENVPESLAKQFSAAGRPEAVTVTLEARSGNASNEKFAEVALERDGGIYRLNAAKAAGATAGVTATWTLPEDPDALYFTLKNDPALQASRENPWHLSVQAAQASGTSDILEGTLPAPAAYEANCAFVLHGNQGIGYSDVLHGRSDDLDGSGFDEALQVHEANSVPGNFHMSGTLQTTAEWAARNGDATDFNAWLTAGAAAGWAGMITSAYGQHMMPFVNDDMNDWAVSIETQMIDTRYGYFPTVAWVPERVWLNTTGYPSNGVNDWIGDNWQAHGVQGVILDDDVHLTGHDNHQIHTLAANGLRLIPRDRSFTGNIIGGNGQAALDILTGLADGGVGEFRIAVFAEDWEAASEMGGWASIVPNAKETYDWIIGKCATESAWLHTWKLADALGHANFNGDTFNPTPGTYNEIGGFDGYGGADNSWYSHWAGWIPWVTGGDGNGACRNDGIGNCKNYGTLWNDAYTALMAAPDNDISQAGWYVLMTNLHETAWHDYQGGPISGWQHNYSAHMKNAMIYAEAAHWANGEFATTTDAYAADIDNDGYSEFILHNDHLFAVFRGAGGRLTNLFVKGAGYGDTAIGNDNAYWSDTNADYNDPNHVGAFSEVSPNYQNNLYDPVVTVDGTTVTLEMTHNEVSKTIILNEGDSFFDVVYRVGSATHWIQSGFSPSLVDQVWNAELDRVWPSDGAYMGQRNPNTGIATALLLGAGGAQHQKEIAGTLMKGDEIFGSEVFQLRLFAGPTGVADGTGDISELRVLADQVSDTIGPSVVEAVFIPSTGRLRLTFDQAVYTADPAGVKVTEGPDAIVEEVTLPGTTPISETLPSSTVTFELDTPTAAAMDALSDIQGLFLQLTAGSFTDALANSNSAVTDQDMFPVTKVTTAVNIDGHIEDVEWNTAQVLADSNDSAWSASNEIDRLLVRWDQEFVYVAIDGVVTNNSWLLYLDVDPGTANGQTDLTATDSWERGASFTAPGFSPDFQYGCYQHQSVYDGDGFWQLLTATTTADRGGEIQSAYDSFHVYGDGGGSEMAIPWNTLYGLGSGIVPVGAQISLVASICYDPEPDGVLGGDSAPSNSIAALPVIDASWTLNVDANGDGLPDMGESAAGEPVRARLRLLPNVPNPFNPITTLHFEIPGTGTTHVRLDIFDLRGRRLITLVDGLLEAGNHTAVWDGRTANGRSAAAGTYFSRLNSGGQIVSRPLSLIK
jgi:hypothetical protein